MKNFTNALAFYSKICYTTNKKSTHSIVDALGFGLHVLTDTAYPVGRQDKLFLRKAPTPKWMLSVKLNRPYGHRLSCVLTG